MSQGAEVFSLTMTAYLRLIPLLRSASAVGVTAAVGAAFLGPVGVFPGAAVGVAATRWAQMFLDGFTTLLQFVQQHPYLLALVTGVILQLRNYLGQRQDQLEHEEGH